MFDPDESFTVRKDEKTREANRQERVSKLEKKTVKPKGADEDEPVSNWFTRQFGNLFSEDDDEIDK